MSSSVIQTPLVVGHRGCAGEAPENTLASFQLALDQGCDAIELDVHLSADGQIVVCHDPTVQRTTDGTGWIYQMTVEQLKQLDAGAWFHKRFAGERIPTLDEVLQLVPKHILINIEIKHSYNHQLEARLLALLHASGRKKQVIISSFDHKCLARLKRLEPALKIGLLYSENVVNHVKYAQLPGFPIHSLHPHHRFIEDEDVRAALQAGLRVYPYTVNEESQLRRWIGLGTTGIITDYPGKLRALLTNLQQ
jgi:glycerophosphoryl diester phosphodiesterase